MPGNRPVELSCCVRRGRELSEVRRLLQAAQAIALTGPGGMGKSRLALQRYLNYPRREATRRGSPPCRPTGVCDGSRPRSTETTSSAQTTRRGIPLNASLT